MLLSWSANSCSPETQSDGITPPPTIARPGLHPVLIDRVLANSKSCLYHAPTTRKKNMLAKPWHGKLTA